MWRNVQILEFLGFLSIFHKVLPNPIAAFFCSMISPYCMDITHPDLLQLSVLSFLQTEWFFLASESWIVPFLEQYAWRKDFSIQCSLFFLFVSLKKMLSCALKGTHLAPSHLPPLLSEDRI